jgi:ATP-dependent DNA helicase DinG
MSTLFAKNGLISRQWSPFVYRPGQQQLAVEITKAFQHQQILLAEAPTGTGKTFAYLASVLESDVPVVISTASHALQYQLVHHDIPELAKILSKSPAVVELKGIGSYFCPQRVDQALARGVEKRQANALLSMRHFWQRRQTKMLEWRLIAEQVGAKVSEVSHYSATSHHRCQSKDCPHFNRCPYFNQRKKLATADIAVVNHALFFSSEDFLLTTTSAVIGKKLSPYFQAVVFDEAHKLDQLSIDRATVCFDSRQLLRLLPQFCAVVQRDAGDSRPCLLAARRCFKLAQSLDAWVKDEIDPGSADWQDLLVDSKTLSNQWRQWRQQYSLMLAYSDLLSQRSEALAMLNRRLKRYDVGSLAVSPDAKQNEGTLWFNRQGSSWSIHSVEVNHLQLMHALPPTQIYLSSALSVDDDFTNFAEVLKLPSYRSFKVAERQGKDCRALYYQPMALPAPSSPNHIEQLLGDILPLLNANRGRALLLFSSVSNRLKAEQWLRQYSGFNLCIAAQGSAAQAVRRFKSEPLSLLLSAGL